MNQGCQGVGRRTALRSDSGKLRRWYRLAQNTLVPRQMCHLKCVGCLSMSHVGLTNRPALTGVGFTWCWENQVFPAASKCSAQTQRAWRGKRVREMLTVSHLPGANTQWEGSVLWLLLNYCTAVSCFTAQSGNYHLWRKQQLLHSSTLFFRSMGPIKRQL